MERIDAEAVSQPFGHRTEARDAAVSHGCFHTSPGGGATKPPDAKGGKLRIPLRDPQLEYAIEIKKHRLGQRHLPDDAGLSPLQRDERDRLAVQVDGGRGDGQHFRNARAGPDERLAKQPLGRWKRLRRLKKSPSFGTV